MNIFNVLLCSLISFFFSFFPSFFLVFLSPSSPHVLVRPLFFFFFHLPPIPKTANRKRRKYIDYGKEIPFQRNAPAGFYDISEENHAAKRTREDPSFSTKLVILTVPFASFTLLYIILFFLYDRFFCVIFPAKYGLILLFFSVFWLLPH